MTGEQLQPLRVENRGAWSMLARKDSVAGDAMVTLALPGGSGSGRSPNSTKVDDVATPSGSSSTLWNYARSMEQQKLQKEQRRDTWLAEDVAAARQREREAELRRQEEAEVERQRAEHAAAAQLRHAREERFREAEKALALQRAEERDRLKRELVIHPHDEVLSEDLACFSSASFF